MQQSEVNMFDMTANRLSDATVVREWYGESETEFKWVIVMSSAHQVWSCYSINEGVIDFYIVEPNSTSMICIGELQVEEDMEEQAVTDAMVDWVYANLGIEL